MLALMYTGLWKYSRQGKLLPTFFGCPRKKEKQNVDRPKPSQPSKALIDPLNPKKKRKIAIGSRSRSSRSSIISRSDFSVPKRTQGFVGGCGIFAAATAKRLMRLSCQGMSTGSQGCHSNNAIKESSHWAPACICVVSVCVRCSYAMLCADRQVGFSGPGYKSRCHVQPAAEMLRSFRCQVASPLFRAVLAGVLLARFWLSSGWPFPHCLPGRPASWRNCWKKQHFS